MRISTSLSKHSIARWNPKNYIVRGISHHAVLLTATCMIVLLSIQKSQHVLAELDPLSPPMSPVVSEGDSPDECEACKLLVKSFDLGLERTMRGKHEGGDTHWEEKNLRSYSDSEVRLVEIQEELCSELTKGKAQCFSIAEDSETDIEEWWFKHKNKNVRLHDYLCINKLKKCCPEGKYGATCQPCPSDCNKRGTCDGSGTRGGNGKCVCQPGYVGSECDGCDSNYYKMRTDDGLKFVCSSCHHACEGGCDGPTSANCTQCRAGYSRDPETKLCIDINECELSPEGMPAETASRVCPDGTYCVNTDGHYKCSSCHTVCSTCLDYGMDKCITCAANYEMDEEKHICTHFSQLSLNNPYSDGSYFSLKGYSRYILVAYYVILLVTISASILWQLYINWRTGQYHELMSMRQALSLIAISLTVLFQSDVFSSAITMQR